MSAQPTQPGANAEIMVVEDNPSDIKFLSDILTEAGYQVRAASDGTLALRSARAKLPDLMLLDINLPDMNGVEVCRRFKAEPDTSFIPVIFISALGKTDLKVNALEGGGVDYITKPFDAAEVLARIDTHLNMHRLQQKLSTQSKALMAEIEVRKQAEKELQKHRDHLEAMVNERTAELQQEIVERRQNEVALKESEDRFRSLYENAPLSYQSLDSEGNFIAVNDAWLKVLGYERHEVIGSNFSQFLAPDWKGHFYENFPRFKSVGEILGVEFEMVKKNGDSILVSFHGKISCDGEGDFKQTHCVFRDITEERKILDQKELLESRLQQAQKMESIGNLAGGIAHDFNNILSPVIGMSEMLLEDLPSGSLEFENVREILKAGERGSDLVKQILAFSRQTEHKMLPIKVQHVLEEVLKLARSTIPSNIEISHYIQPDCGLVKADPTQIHQIALNLITNAYHAVEHNSGGISVRLVETVFDQPQIGERDLQPGKYAMLSVADKGSGIDFSIKDKIFEPYFTTKDKGKGTGLGLAVVYGIVKEHHGDINVTTELGKGTTFNVYLPLHHATDEGIRIEPTEIPIARGESILFVDDEISIVLLVKKMLERIGYKVTSHENSLEALEAFSATPLAFDLVVTDMAMPNMTGDQLTKKVKEIRPDIPVIICTGFSERINKENAKAAGISGFLMKPMIKSEMAQMVREVLDEVKDSTQA